MKWLSVLTLIAALSTSAFAGRKKAENCEVLFGDDPKALAAQLKAERQVAHEQNKFISAYTQLARMHQRNPTFAELGAKLDMLPSAVEALIKQGTHFDDMRELKERAVAKTPKAFQHFTDRDVFTHEREEKLMTAIQSSKRLILTTAIAGAPVNRAFFESLRNYAKTMNAEIVVIPANMMTMGLDPLLLNTPGVHVMINNVELSPWYNVSNVKILAKNKNPLKTLEDLSVPRGQSQIGASAKMHVKIIPTTDNQVNPHQLMTTGAVTDPVYKDIRFLPTNQESIAAAEHVMGALILERNNGGPNTLGIQTAGTYHTRHVEFYPAKGGFTDLGKFYDANSVKKVAPKALILGDIHVGDTDQSLLESVKKLILELKPEVIVLHDLLNGHSISHHERNKLITLSKKAQAGQLSLEKEIRDVVTFLNSLMSIDSGLQIVIVPSNHNFWLHRWLDEGEFMKGDNQNRSLGIKLAAAYDAGEDPVKFALLNNGIEPAKKKRITFLPTGGRYKVGPKDNLVELAMHGHAGANGAKGSLKSLQRGATRVVYGHTHTDQRMNGAVNVGTSTELILPYSRDGLSNWKQSLALVSENGEIQVLKMQDGEWYTDTDQETLAPTEFFMPDYPRMTPNDP